ncbi:hypothetical protein H710_00393 [Bartonella bacilliformis Ver097]|uniref:Uncharacterized protein n=1 Tax=Bartonella bacilliformis Ver097 TaxID=1293911 RepID=A0A072R887_BARBA|nr:hypothetical protein H710_00393 [Bartonella bacilliformis Ver097]
MHNTIQPHAKPHKILMRALIRLHFIISLAIYFLYILYFSLQLLKQLANYGDILPFSSLAPCPPTIGLIQSVLFFCFALPHAHLQFTILTDTTNDEKRHQTPFKLKVLSCKLKSCALKTLFFIYNGT